MKSNCYQRFLMDAACRFRHHVKQAGQLVDEQAIHDFRVAVKEIEAFHKPLNSLASDEQQKMLSRWDHRLQKIYKPAGKYRNGRIIHKLGHRSGIWDLLPQAEVHLLVKNESRLLAFKHELHTYRFPQLAEIKVFIQSVTHHLDTAINQTIRDNYAQALPLLTRPSGIHWHEARGLIKNNYFLLQAQSQCSQCVINNESLILTGILEKELGNWHDWILLHQYVMLHEIGVVSANKAAALSCIQHSLIQVENQIISRAELLRGIL